jgi:hypothetical protein
MKSVIKWVVFIGLIMAALYFFVDRQELDGRLSRSNGRIANIEDSLDRAQYKIDSLEASRDSLSEKTGELEARVSFLDEQLVQTNKAHKDSIEAIQEAKLSDLVDSTRIIYKDDTAFVLVSERYYRQSLTSEVELKRLRSIVGIYKNKAHLKDSIIELKDKSIFNLMDQVANYKQQLGLKDSIITEKDFQLNIQEKRIRKIKLQRNITIGAGLGIILLIIL